MSKYDCGFTRDAEAKICECGKKKLKLKCLGQEIEKKIEKKFERI